MSEDFHKQIEAAVKAVRREEDKRTFSEEEAVGHIHWHLAHNFIESWDGKGPVPDTLFKLLNWASDQYFLKFLQELRRQDAVAEHESRQKSAS